MQLEWQPVWSRHAKLPQLATGVGAQAPVPSQSWTSMVLALQPIGPHGVPGGVKEQAPAPSHVPPQAPSPAHSPAGSWPCGTVRQLPSAEGRLHAMQAASQADSQHTPSAQKPEAHWRARSQGAPSLRAPASQAPAAQ
jgi:hypothetical protein